MLDANVWISALIWGGKPAAIIKAAENHKIRIFLSEEILDEISQVLNYPRLSKIYIAEGLSREDLIETVLKIGKLVNVTKKSKAITDHPADDKFLDCASAANADSVVSGDKHLLKAGCYMKTKILSVNEFLRLINVKNSGPQR